MTHMPVTSRNFIILCHGAHFIINNFTHSKRFKTRQISPTRDLQMLTTAPGVASTCFSSPRTQDVRRDGVVCSHWALQERERGRVYTTRRHVVHSASESGLASPSGIASRGSRQRKSQSYVKSTLAGEAGGRQAWFGHEGLRDRSVWLGFSWMGSEGCQVKGEQYWKRSISWEQLKYFLKGSRSCSKCFTNRPTYSPQAAGSPLPDCASQVTKLRLWV
jgi:hypothetical protein